MSGTFATRRTQRLIVGAVLFSFYYWHESDGLAAVLGTSIPAFVLIIAFVVLLFIFIKDKKERFLYCLGTVGTDLIIILLTLIINLGSFKDFTKYSKENWLNIEEKYKYYVLEDFLANYDMKSMTREEVVSYLGNPDEDNPGADDYRYYTYYVGIPVRLNRLEQYQFHVDFKNDKVFRYILK